MPDRRTADPQSMDRILLRTVQPQHQRRPSSTKLSTDYLRGRLPHSSWGSGGCSKEKSEKKESQLELRNWSHTSWTGSSWGEALITTLTTICNKIWQTGEWPTPWTQSLIITLPKKGNLHMCQNYRTICHISHPSKVMLTILLNKYKPQAEEIIAEEQAGFRAGRNTGEQIFNLRMLCEKYLQHPQSLYHVFLDSKKAFDKVWHAAL